MPYTITLTDGSPLTTITDGTVDNTTSLTLVGRNYAGYGTDIAENFVHILESAANTTAPTSPLTGQLWYDTNVPQALMIWDGAAWVLAGLPANSTFNQSITIQDTTANNHGFYFYDALAPSGSKNYRIRIRDDGGFAGRWVFESLNDDLSFKNTTLNIDSLGNIYSPTFVGIPTAPTPSIADNSTALATTAYVRENIRTKLTAPLAVYVSNSGTDDDAHGLATGAGAFATIQFAINFVYNMYDANGNIIFINLADGTYTGATLGGQLMGGNYAAYGGSTFTGIISGGTPYKLTVSGVSGGVLSVGSVVTGSGVTGSGTTCYIAAFGYPGSGSPGDGGNGDYTLSVATIGGVSSETMTTGPGGVLPLLIVGDITNPGAVIINAGGTGNCFEVTNGAQVWLTGMTLTSTGSGIIAAANGGVVQLGAGLIFGSCTSGNHMTATTGALIQDFGIPYTVNGSAVYHWVAAENGGINITGPLTITLNNALTFTYFAHVDTNGVIYTTGNTGSGNHVTFTVTTSVTGGYYDAESNGVIQTFASGNSYFPGTSGFQPVAGPGTTPYGLYV